MGKVSIVELKIPNLGEAEETEIIEINIASGSLVNENDPLIVLESEKAAMEIPSDFSGKITELMVKEGDLVQEGQVFAIIESSSQIEKNEPYSEEAKEENNFNQGCEKKINENNLSVNLNLSGINAGPAVRKYARELEIDLTKITPTGRNRKITKEDLKKFIHSKDESNLPFVNYKESDFNDIGEYEIQNLSKIRSIGARNLHQSWISIPHVTHFEEIEMERINALKSGKGLSPLSVVCQAFVETLQIFPIFNSSLIEKDRLLIKRTVNLGIAVDTEQGLVVPVIKNTNEMSAKEIMECISDLAERAKSKKLLSNDLNGASATVSSLGKLGGIGFTPIINPPEVCILAVSRSKKVLGLDDEGKVIQKELLPVSLSYDHRVINGADAGRFMDKFKYLLENIK
jgi:pyruvate dehydrogenase E2 component (dihydrolipoamide acetyltransferase)